MRHLLFTDKDVLKKHISLPTLPKKTPSGPIGNRVAFITGTTGFIGGFLLKELLKRSAFESYVCLVRAESRAAGFERLKANLVSKGTPEYLIDSNVITVAVGDVLTNNFGLSDSLWVDLSHKVDHVFHFAATMHWVTPFNNDTVANINALKTAIQFSATGKLKKLHYASSMGMWTLLNHRNDTILETNIHDQGNELPGGYFQSKWVNENIIELARAEDIPINVYRIGDVKGDSKNGLGDPQNFGNMVMQCFMQSGKAIDWDVPEFNFIPVDYLAKAIAHISTNQTNQTFQFSNPELISFKDIYESAVVVGHDIRLVGKDQWLEMLTKEESGLGRQLKPIFKMFTPDPSQKPTSFYQIGVDMFTKNHDTTNTEMALKGTKIICPAMRSEGVLNQYITHLGAVITH